MLLLRTLVCRNQVRETAGTDIHNDLWRGPPLEQPQQCPLSRHQVRVSCVCMCVCVCACVCVCVWIPWKFNLWLSLDAVKRYFIFIPTSEYFLDAQKGSDFCVRSLIGSGSVTRTSCIRGNALHLYSIFILVLGRSGFCVLVIWKGFLREKAPHAAVTEWTQIHISRKYFNICSEMPATPEVLFQASLLI